MLLGVSSAVIGPIFVITVAIGQAMSLESRKLMAPMVTTFWAIIPTTLVITTVITTVAVITATIAVAVTVSSAFLAAGFGKA